MRSRITLVFLSLLLFITAIPAAAKLQDCPPHPKSAAGVMPPACVLGTDAPALASLSGAPDATFLNAAQSVPTGSWPQVLGAADFDGAAGDGRSQLAAATERYFDPANDRQLHLFTINSTGALGRTQQLPAGVSPEAAQPLDVNHDDVSDLALALAGENKLAVYIAGAGALSVPALLTLDGPADALAVGDVSGDLRDDLIAVVGDTLRFWRSSPAGLVALSISLPYANDGYNALAVGDFNNDGYADIAAMRGAGYATGTVALFFQQSGAFIVGPELNPRLDGFVPAGIAAGDLDGDGQDDLAVTAGGNVPNAYLSLFYQRDSVLNTTPVVLNTFHIPSAIVAADVTHDGREDLVVANDGWRTLSIFTQRPDGSFDPAYLAADIPYSDRFRPDALVVADIDGNGGLDPALVGYPQGLTVLTSKLPAPTATITEPVEGATVQSGYVLVQGSASASATNVQVRVKGLGAWQEVPVAAGLWQAMVSLPSDPRPYTIEARAVDTLGIVQAPWAARRVTTSLVCYAVADNGQQHGSPDRLMRVDMQLGLATLIGTLGTREIESLAFQPTTGALFAAERDRLRTIDLATSIATAAAQPFGNGRGAQGTLRLGDVQGLSFEPASGALYAVARRSQTGKLDLLFRVDPQTGALIRDAFGPGVDYVPISGPGVLPDVDDLAFAPATGLLYGVSNTGGAGGVLITINPATGAGSVVGALGVEDVEGLTVTPSAALYGVTGYKFRATADRLWTISPTSGAATLVGPMGIETDYEGLACLPARIAPPPSAQALQPRLTALSIDAGATQTSERTVTLRAPSVHQPAGVLFAEYRYDSALGAWQIVGATRRVSPSAATAGVRWTLANEPGMHYIQAWAVDNRGIIIRPAQQAFINYLPRTIDIAEDVRHIYRYTLAAGETLRVELTSLRGDADVTVWTEEITTPTSLSAQASAPEVVTIHAEQDGLYQLEVHGVQTGTYQLKVLIEPPLEALATAFDASASQTTVANTEPMPPLTSEPDRNLLPETERRVYLPLLRQ